MELSLRYTIFYRKLKLSVNMILSLNLSFNISSVNIIQDHKSFFFAKINIYKLMLPYTLNHQLTKKWCTPDLLMQKYASLQAALVCTASNLTALCCTENTSLHCPDMHCFGPY